MYGVAAAPAQRAQALHLSKMTAGGDVGMGRREARFGPAQHGRTACHGLCYISLQSPLRGL